MEEKWILVCLVVVMFCGSYLSGIVPLSIKFSEDKLKKITVFGAGLLVGTALAVIIPEGVRSLVIESGGAHANNGISNAFIEETHKHDQEHALSVIGYCLILGFIFMLIVDQLSQRRNHNLNPADRNITATIGLVVHAAADGVALGAAATTSHHDVEIIVFLAIMLHKAPAAFGLVTFLLHEGIERSRIKRHLFIFSISAPALTVITYIGIGEKGSEALSSFNATGIAMLISAGTFLYVATVHVLADLTQTTHDTSYARISSEDGTFSSRYSNVESGIKGAPPTAPPLKALTLTELVILAVGCVTPLVLTMGHSH